MLNCFSQQNLINKESDEENSEEKESDDKEISETKIKEIIKITTNDNIEISLPDNICLLYTSPSPRDGLLSRMPSSA